MPSIDFADPQPARAPTTKEPIASRAPRVLIRTTPVTSSAHHICLMPIDSAPIVDERPNLMRSCSGADLSTLRRTTDRSTAGRVSPLPAVVAHDIVGDRLRLGHSERPREGDDVAVGQDRDFRFSASVRPRDVRRAAQVGDR